MRGGVELFDAGVIFESFVPDANERIVVNGPGAVEAFMRAFLGQWRDYRLFGDQFQQVGGDKVFVRGRQTAIGRKSGVAVEDTMFSVWTFRDGKVVHLLFDRDEERAIEAAEMSE
jgi:hypothetical protein